MASRCYQNTLGPEPLDLHHHLDLAGEQTTHAYRRVNITLFTYTGEETRKGIIHEREKERMIKTSLRERHEVKLNSCRKGNQIQNLGNWHDSQRSRTVPGWVLVQEDMPERKERTWGEKGREKEKRERCSKLRCPS